MKFGHKIKVGKLVILVILFTGVLVLGTENNLQKVFAEDTSTFNSTKILSTQTADGDSGDIINDKTFAERLIKEGEQQGTSAAGALILRAINILSLLIGTFAVILLIIAGFMLSAAQGDETRIDRGKAIITQALVGLLIAFSSYIIVTFVQSFFY